MIKIKIKSINTWIDYLTADSQRKSNNSEYNRHHPNFYVTGLAQAHRNKIRIGDGLWKRGKWA